MVSRAEIPKCGELTHTNLIKMHCITPTITLLIKHKLILYVLINLESYKIHDCPAIKMLRMNAYKLTNKALYNSNNHATDQALTHFICADKLRIIQNS